MIFKPELAAKVLAGHKTETRRPVQYLGVNDKLDHVSLYTAGVKPTQYKVGRDYALQPGRGKHAIGRLRVTLVEQTVLGAMTPEQAAAEGFVQDEDGERHGDIAAFRAYWEGLYGPGTALVTVPVWRIAFELGGKCIGCGRFATTSYYTGLDMDLPPVWACAPAHVMIGMWKATL